ncbi:unnamed protein product [Pseudo-nitzschia multistriata]|uniref:Fe2OG dioxygenase domain-containing protein n=1 Tax=Pseudo-nitzschia multistriata TaxID=183589 RepID=A0A448ZMH4_9STRA|nr:unnamed protein product [Pseudo-nitzschia multistriata]
MIPAKFFSTAYLLLALSALLTASAREQPTCSWSACGEEIDPALKEFTYDVGDGPQTTMVYVEPDLATFYEKDGEKYKRVKPAFNGLAGKFINMSNKPYDQYWESYKGGTAHIMRRYAPFSAGGTGTFPTHRFFLSEPGTTDKRVKEWVVGNYPNNIYVYDPYKVEGDPEQTEKNLQANLNAEERVQYDLWTKTLLYNEQYFAFTGRSYLANYGVNGPRAPPMHYMWRADYFGQEHWVTTRETHFVTVPPEDKLGKIRQDLASERILKEEDPRILQEYRAVDEATQEPLQSMNMTLKVLSVAPRVFEIKNFLSRAEVDHILQVAAGVTLAESTTGDVGSDGDPSSRRSNKETKVRTSRNSWVPRERSAVLDAIYRRAADLTRIDEALLRFRGPDEYPELETKQPLAETLQLVHYDPKQEYTAHHDFGYSNIRDQTQGARFATVLFYLNDDMTGGETAFPRYVNGKSFHELKVKPEAGKAVLFYDQLPDGNMDDFSQHAAKPVIQGEKWLINLWIWDPLYERG